MLESTTVEKALFLAEVFCEHTYKSNSFLVVLSLQVGSGKKMNKKNKTDVM